MKHETDIALIKAHAASQGVAIEDITKVTDGFVADRNKLMGAAWLGGALGGFGFLGGIGALVINFFKH
jgi:hypothetical protein